MVKIYNIDGYRLTRLGLGVLCAINKSIQESGAADMGAVTWMLGIHRSMVRGILHNDVGNAPVKTWGLYQKGLVAQEYGTTSTLRLTETGAAIVRQLSFWYEDGAWKIGFIDKK